MVEDYRKEDFERLKSEVETLVGRKIASPKDFAFLMRQIHGYTQETISVSTETPSRHNESCLTTARYCPGKGQYCAIVRQKTQVPNNGMSCRPGTLARGRLEADYYKVFP